jgi:8-oxo-dGTP diphosphatase / 2-hydroxy-dATP diphosphatase
MEKVKNRKVLTLCIVQKGDRVLLGMKKRGFGQGRWNGFGGKLCEGETIEQGAVREMKEEAGVQVDNLDKIGIIEFEFQGNLKILEVHVFKTGTFLGEVIESEEMKPQWFSVHEIPFDTMWPDDKYWMPLFLENKKFTAKFLFGKEDVVLEHKLLEVNTL